MMTTESRKKSGKNVSDIQISTIGNDEENI